MSDSFAQIAPYLPKSFSDAIYSQSDSKRIEEIRLRAGRNLEVISNGDYINLPITVSTEEILFILQNATGHSLFAFENQINNGYITMEGGHRIGFCGRVFCSGGAIGKIDEFGSLNIRIAKEIKGSAKKLLEYIVKDGVLCSAIIASPPCVGKTTVLRDICRIIGSGEFINKAYKISLIDERGEIAAAKHGVPQLDVGQRTDVFDNCPKSVGMMLALRSMSPEVIVTDEIGTKEDMEAIETATCCGVKVMASVHASDLKELMHRLSHTDKTDRNAFEKIVFIGRDKSGVYIKKIYDNDYTELEI